MDSFSQIWFQAGQSKHMKLREEQVEMRYRRYILVEKMTNIEKKDKVGVKKNIITLSISMYFRYTKDIL